MENKRPLQFSEILNEPFLLLDAELRIIDCNNAFLRLLGANRKNLVGKHLPELAADPQHFNATGRRWRNSAQLIPGKLSLIHSDGSPIPLHCEGGRIPTEDQNMILVRCNTQGGLAQKFTELNQKLESLDNEIYRRKIIERRLSRLLDSTSRVAGKDFFPKLAEGLSDSLGVKCALIAKVDPDNRDLVNCLGFWRDGNAIPDFSYRLAGTPCERVYESGELFVSDRAKSLFPDDEDLQALIIESYFGVEIRNPSGQQLGHICIFDDKPLLVDEYVSGVLRSFGVRASTEILREEAEQALKSSYTQLELRVEERTEQLSRALKEAKIATQAKSNFLANMSHEIRTPMNGVLGMLGLLRDSELNNVQQDFLETALSSSETLLNVLNDILDLSKIEAGKLELEVREFNLRNVLEEVVQLFAQAAHDKDLELTFNADPELDIQVAGDQTRIRQLLSNLISNAIKFTREGEVSVNASAEEGTRGPNLRLILEVQDTGIGIPDELKESIFASFTQADTSVTRQFGGTGLGLTICQQLCELMGGSIKMQSSPGLGSKFSVTVELESLPHKKTPATTLPSEFAGLRVLIVDDNQTNRIILQHMIENWGISAEVTDGGQAALSLIKKALDSDSPYSVVLLDSMMPEMSGLDVVRQMDNILKGKKPDVFILTSGIRGDDINEAKSLDVEVLLSKPVRQSQVYDALVNLVQGAETTNAQIQRKTRASEEAIKLPGKILIAEDNLVNQKLILAVLNDMGHECVVVDDGQQALEAYESGQFDIVFMDCQMPVLDGYSATTCIRKIERSTDDHIPVIAMTANAMAGDKEVCLAAGMDDYISKPLDLEELRKLVESWLPVVD